MTHTDQPERPPIATLPPLDTPTPHTVPVSPRTGEPRRPWVLLLAVALFHVGAAVASAGMLWALWVCVTNYQNAARILIWTHPNPVSFLGILMVIVIALIGVVVAGAASWVGYYAWAGGGWTRWGGLAAVAISGLTYLISPYAMYAMIPIALAAGLLWLPPIRRFFTTFVAARGHGPALAPPRAEPVVYGTLPRYL